jgi:hypothetical protein
MNSICDESVGDGDGAVAVGAKAEGELGGERYESIKRGLYATEIQ